MIYACVAHFQLWNEHKHWSSFQLPKALNMKTTRNQGITSRLIWFLTSSPAWANSLMTTHKRLFCWALTVRCWILQISTSNGSAVTAIMLFIKCAYYKTRCSSWNFVQQGKSLNLTIFQLNRVGSSANSGSVQVRSLPSIKKDLKNVQHFIVKKFKRIQHFVAICNT